jgi:polysaccharide export outer membrane protein
MNFKKNLPVTYMQRHYILGRSWLGLVTCFLGLNLFVSCTPAKNILYFQNLPNDTVLHNLVTKDFELKIRKGDILNIGVSSLSTEVSAIFTAPQLASGDAAASGFLVDNNGDILYPKLGVLRVEGLTRNELKNRLLKDLLPYVREPVVTVSFVNHKVTVLGEANKVFPMQNETLTLLEVISLSGGIPKSARKDNILVIRENGGDKQFKRLNLNNSSIFTSPFYYLRPDDIVYIEPDPAQLKSTTSTAQIISYVSTGLSFIFLILSRVK